MRRVARFAVCLLVVGCFGKSKERDAGIPDAGPTVVGENEPNDKPEAAQPLSRSSRVDGQLGADPSKPDGDYYLLAPLAPALVDVSVSGIPGVDVTIELFDRDQNRLVLINSEGEGKPERVPNVLVRDRIWLKIAAAKKGNGGAYALTALFAEPVPGYEAEPNDRAVDANVMSLGQSVSGYLGHSADVDWYRFDLSPSPPDAVPLPPPSVEDAGTELLSDAGTPAPYEPSMALRLELRGVAGVRFELSVLSAAEAPLFTVKTKEGEGLSLRNVGVRAQDQVVYVVVKSVWETAGKEIRKSYNADAPYTLSVGQEEAGATAELESNDEMAKATPLPPQGFREGFLSPKADVDYYVFRTEEPSLVKLELTPAERLDLVLSVVKAPTEDGKPEQTVLRSSDGAVKEPEVLNNVFCERECFVRVEGAQKKIDGKWVRDFENSEMPYRLNVSSAPASSGESSGEEREPNNDPDQATPIELGKPVRGTVLPKKDADFYRLDLSERPVKTAIRATATGILKVDIALFLHQLDADGKPSLLQTADRAKGEQPEVIRYTVEPGVYLLEVRDKKNRESNFQDRYQLNVDEGT